MRNKIFLTSAAIIASASMAAAATVDVTGISPLDNPDQLVGVNAFTESGDGLFGLKFVSSPSFTVNGNAKLTFTEVGAESGYDNFFSFAGINFSETNEFVSNDSADLDFTSAGRESQTITVADGATLVGMRFFTTSPFYEAVVGGANAYDFGVFFDSTDPRNGTGLTKFFIAYDDIPGRDAVDDNHDDYVIMVEVSPVPLPAAGWMLLAGIGGLAALKRRRKQAAA